MDYVTVILSNNCLDTMQRFQLKKKQKKNSKDVIRCRKSQKNRQHNDQKRNTKGPTMTYTIHETKERKHKLH